MNHEQTTAAVGSNQTANESNTNSEKQHAPAIQEQQNQNQTTQQSAADKIKELEARLTDLNIKYETLKQASNAKPLEYPPVVDTNKLPEYIKALKTQWGLK